MLCVCRATPSLIRYFSFTKTRVRKVTLVAEGQAMLVAIKRLSAEERVTAAARRVG